MAKPRIFISSTFYDLRHVRADIERFVSELGYDAVANERGDIAYGIDEALEEYCYKEIEGTDIVVSIVGGRFGSESQKSENSISQMEVKQAIKAGKQIFVFVDSDVLSELKTYKVNKSVDGMKYAQVDNVKIFEFLEEIESLKKGNPIFPFKESNQIIGILREQLAGLFQRFLTTQLKQEEIRLVDSLKASTQSLQDVVKYLQSNTNKNDGDAIKGILLPTHPLFADLAKLMNVSYRVYFQNKDELDRFLQARGYEVDQLPLDDETFEWNRITRKSVGQSTRQRVQTLSISRSLFGENGDLKYVSPADWSPELILLLDSDSIDDGIPF